MTKQAIMLRAIEPSDIDLIFQWENDKTIWHLSNTLAPYSRRTLEQYIENAQFDIYQAKQLRLMIDQKEGDSLRTLGCIDLFDFNPFHLRAGVGILIAEKADRNKGTATQALKELIKYAFDILNLHQLYCNIGSGNSASLKLFEKIGFSKIGAKKDWNKVPGGFEDEYLLQMISGDSSG